MKKIFILALLLIGLPVSANIELQKNIDNIGFNILNSNKINKRIIFTYSTKDKKFKGNPELTKRQIIVYKDDINYTENNDEIAALLSRKICDSVKSFDGAWGGAVSAAQVKMAPKKFEMVSDKRAVDYMVHAGYNPLGLITFITKSSPEKRFDRFSNHNLTSKRLTAIYEYIYTNYPYYIKENTYLDNKYFQNFLLNSVDERREIDKPEVVSYDFSNTEKIPIYLEVLNPITTKKELNEGEILELQVSNNVYHNQNLILKRGEKAKARVQMIVTSGMNGIPYDIYLTDFELKNIDNRKLLANYHKSGTNRTYWVLPLKWALTPLPPTGSLTNFIKGGHAKITEKDKIVIYYFPNWRIF